MAYHDYIGQNVILKTADNQIFKGTLSSLDEYSGKIVLKNASINDGSKLPGLQNFFASSIKELSLTQRLHASRISDNPRRGGRNRHTSLLRKDFPDRSHLKKLLRFDSDQLIRSNCLGGDSGDQGIGSGEDNESTDFYEEENFTMFYQTCEKFRDTITYLAGQNAIAVTFFGTDIGRKGTLSLIQIATEEYNLFYDILRLGREGFVDGLQTILESNNVMKIIHDSRMISDLLYNQFQVSLANVFDTQVANACVFRASNEGCWPRFVESLPGVLMLHLGLKNEEVHHFFVRERLRQRDEEVWLQRPLCTQLLEDSLKNLVHMIPLYRILQAKMMTEFHIGVQLYLDQVRNAPSDKVDNFRSFSHMLPFVFQDLPKLVTHYSNSANRLKCVYKGSSGFVDVSPRSGPNTVTTSRDGIWHSKDTFCKASCQCGSKHSTKTISEDGVKVKRHDQKAIEPKAEKSNLLHNSVKHTESVSSQKPASTENIGDNSNRCNKNINENCQKNTSLPPNSPCLKSKLFISPPSSQCTKESIFPSCLNTESELEVINNNLNQPSPFQSTQELQLASQLKNNLHVSKSDVKVKDGVKLNESPATAPKTGDQASTCEEIPSILKRSALFQLGSSYSSSPQVSFNKCQSDFVTNDVSPTSRGALSPDILREEDVDKLFEFEMVQKILKQARQQGSHSSKAEVKKRLLPSKSKISTSPLLRNS